jgi:hypothetical protein
MRGLSALMESGSVFKVGCDLRDFAFEALADDHGPAQDEHSNHVQNELLAREYFG